MNKHLEAAKGYIAVAESGDAKREAYAKAADELLIAQAEGLTLTEIGTQIGKDRTWVGKLLGWRRDRDPAASPFHNTAAQERYVARKVPTRHEDKVEMATKLLEDKKVAQAVISKPSKAQLVVEHAVYDKKADRREKDREQNRKRRESGAMPLPAYMARMVEKMTEWTLGMHAISDEDLDALPEGRSRELVAKSARDLAREAQRWLDRLDVWSAEEIEDNVIEGQFSILDEEKVTA